MFRITLLVTLIFGIASKPYKLWNESSKNNFHDNLMSVDAKEKMALSVEVEPPEDTDQTDDDIEPEMKIWEDVAAQHIPLAEADLDDVQHPSLQKLLAEDEDEPEQDWDEVYQKIRAELDGYLAPLTAEYKMMAQRARLEPKETVPLELVRRHLEPEVDLDDWYHPDVQSRFPSYHENYDDNVAAPFEWKSDKNYDQPEEDLDHLYHR
ncbi:uncharacterized protein si:ch211-217g15.3 [Syngnathoides biaculeatus]|uniref:uncharacterized protein si:ch211-217g15.3 n=1 Tax=Syngnathoides biaculeatus TaxID=300417 RepID=UPI002ADD7E8F|nr:uncharacterized protein si:ch211-217g15.3 [Syngnathoides biaculeatus]